MCPPGPTQYIFHMPMAQCSLYVLKVSLNTHKNIKLTVIHEHGHFDDYVMCCLRSLKFLESSCKEPQISLNFLWELLEGP